MFGQKVQVTLLLFQHLPSQNASLIILYVSNF